MSDLSYTQFLLKKQEILMAGVPDLPTDYEVIVIGTGLEESILAAALSRNGHSVLHIDTEDYYGEAWAAFNFRGIQDWIQKCIGDKKSDIDLESARSLLKDGEKLHSINADNSIRDVKETWHVDDEEKVLKEEIPHTENVEHVENEEKNDGDKHVIQETDDASEKVEADAQIESEKNETSEKNAQDNEESQEKGPKESEMPKEVTKPPKWTKNRILEERMFNIDLTPRLLYSRGSMVDLLIQSNISRYTEFKTVSRVLTVLKGMLEHVPSSRADVFATKHISVVEKRILMKFLTFCLNFEEHPEIYESYQDQSYHEFLKHEKLTDNLIHFIIHSIAMVDKKITTLEGLKATQKFLSSLGRFGNTPFLYSSFGSGEIPQAFCRLCAVFGGTYYLGRSIEAVISDANDKCVGIVSNGLRLNCQKLVMRGQTCPADLKQVRQNSSLEIIERKICLATDSILPSEKEQLTFLSVPPKTPEDGYTFVTEVGHGAAVCPRGMYCLHLTKKFNDAENPGVEQSFKTVMQSEAQVLWTLDFKIETEDLESIDKSSLFLTSGPHFELDYDLTIEHARKLFQDMYPEEPFLPRAPDPEEIILGEPDEPTPPEETEEKVDEKETVEKVDEEKTEEKKEDSKVSEDGKEQSITSE